MNKIDNKNRIIEEIKAFVAAENAKCTLTGIWQVPIVGFADAKGEYIKQLRNIAHPQHQMPEEVLEDAKTIIVYFVPFEKWVSVYPVDKKQVEIGVETGKEDENLASPQWAESYELTNAMFGRLNEHIIKTINSMGYEASEASEAGIFYRDEVISHWSFRHLAYAAGLGTFGMNNMLITEKGCSGRYNAIVTNLEIEPNSPQKEEACLYKKDGTCGVCMKRCPAGALSKNGFNRHKCYDQCLKNAKIYNNFGSSYGGDGEEYGSEVCGKCIVGMPCAHEKP